jgi:hypothetical protein
MQVSINIKDTIDDCRLEINNVPDCEDEVLLNIHIPSHDDFVSVQVKIEDLRLAIRKLTCK